MCAGVILTVGMVALLGLFTYAISSLQFSKEELVAKQKAREALEAIYSARSTGQISFDQIQNQSRGGLFLDGMQSIKQSGSDGLFGTADDGPDYDYVLQPGPDGDLASASKQYLTNYKREIKFESLYMDKEKKLLNPDLRQITVTVQYSVQRWQRSVRVVGMISSSR